jgi:hypothetical protein
MKKLSRVNLLTIGFVACATNSFADQTTSTVNFPASVDVQCCIITPIILNSSSSEQSALSRAAAQALVRA